MGDGDRRSRENRDFWFFVGGAAFAVLLSVVSRALG